MCYLSSVFFCFVAVFNKCSAVAEVGDCLATIDMGRKEGAAVPLLEGRWVPIYLTQCGLGRGLFPYQVASWSIQPFGHHRYGLKSERVLCPFLGGAGSPSNTMSPGPMPTSVPNGILIHLAVWPQQTWAESWGSWAPCNTVWPRPTCVPSFILIHPTIWPQYINVTDRTDNGPIAWGEPFYKRSSKNRSED